jgi:hypothetical protein
VISGNLFSFECNDLWFVALHATPVLYTIVTCTINVSMSPMLRQGSTSLGSTSCSLRWSCEITLLTIPKLRLTHEWVLSFVSNDNMIHFGVSILFEYLYFRYPNYTRQFRECCSKYCHLLQSPHPYLRKSLFGWEGLSPFSRNLPENAEWYNQFTVLTGKK